MALTSPIRLASEGPAKVASPVAKLDKPKIGPLIESGTPYWNPIHAVIKGTTKPAPKAIKPLAKTYLTKGSRDW